MASLHLQLTKDIKQMRIQMWTIMNMKWTTQIWSTATWRCTLWPARKQMTYRAETQILTDMRFVEAFEHKGFLGVRGDILILNLEAPRKDVASCTQMWQLLLWNSSPPPYSGMCIWFITFRITCILMCQKNSNELLYRNKSIKMFRCIYYVHIISVWVKIWT